MYYECTMTSLPSWIVFKRIRCFSSSTYSVNQWLYNKQDFVRTGWNNLKPCLLEYNHLTNQQLWLNCVSVMCGFQGSSQEFCFSFLPLMLAAHRHVTTLGSNFKTWHRHKSHAATLHEILAGGVMTVQAENWQVQKMKHSFNLQGSVEGPRQLLCLPKGLDTVAQLAPTSPWQQPGAQPKQRRKQRKLATIDDSHSAAPRLPTENSNTNPLPPEWLSI